MGITNERMLVVGTTILFGTSDLFILSSWAYLCRSGSKLYFEDKLVFHPSISIVSGSRNWCFIERRTQKVPRVICGKFQCDLRAAQAQSLVCLQKGQSCASLCFRSVPLNLQFRDRSFCLKDSLPYLLWTVLGIPSIS